MALFAALIVLHLDDRVQYLIVIIPFYHSYLRLMLIYHPVLNDSVLVLLGLSLMAHIADTARPVLL